jgi:hypothetical protein
MARCETCGNEYAKTMRILLDGEEHVFDSFECAIETLAPRCDHCGCRIIGHGVETDAAVFCGAHCAHQEGAVFARDHV